MFYCPVFTWTGSVDLNVATEQQLSQKRSSSPNIIENRVPVLLATPKLSGPGDIPLTVLLSYSRKALTAQWGLM